MIVVGDRPETRTLVRLLQADTNSAAHFTNLPAALAALRRPGPRFDFVLLEAQDGSDQYHELTHAIRNQGRDIPIALLSYVEAASAHPRLFGVFEKAPHGRRILNCFLEEPQASRTEGNCACDLGRIIYEYQPGPGKGR